MKIIDILEKDRIILNHHFISKKRLFETMAELLSDDESQKLDIYHGMMDREQLGNTSLGNGVAVPHGKALLNNDIKACIIKMSHPIDYEAIDDVPVDVIVGIAFPRIVNKSHRTLMKDTAQLFRQHRLYKKLMIAQSKNELLAEIINEFQLCSS